MQREIHSVSTRTRAHRKHTRTSMKLFLTHLPRHILMAFAILGIILVYTSCDTGSKAQSYKTSAEAINAYASFLSEMRRKDNVSSDKLIADVSAWRTIRDSVVSCLKKDTIRTSHQDQSMIFQHIHDSIRIEFSRIVMSKPCTYSEVVQMKEVASSFTADSDLMQAKTDAEPFFNSLDSIPIYNFKSTRIASVYLDFLTLAHKRGFHSKEDLQDFIREEDRMFRSFLVHLNETGSHDMQEIIKSTEKCCLQVFQSAERKELSYRDALVYMTMRTNRRLILNARQCVDDVKQGKINTPNKARAYMWMLVQPYTSIDGLGIALLTAKDHVLMSKTADDTQHAIDRLGKILQIDKERTKELPALLMKIIVTTF